MKKRIPLLFIVLFCFPGAACTFAKDQPTVFVSILRMAPNEHHAPHPHVICTKCAAVDCLSPECLSVDM